MNDSIIQDISSHINSNKMTEYQHFWKYDLVLTENNHKTKSQILKLYFFECIPAHIWIQTRAVLSPWQRLGALTASFVLYQCAPTHSCCETDKITPSLICSYLRIINAAERKRAEITTNQNHIPGETSLRMSLYIHKKIPPERGIFYIITLQIPTGCVIATRKINVSANEIKHSSRDRTPY